MNKKLLSLVFALVLTLAMFAGCSSNEDLGVISGKDSENSVSAEGTWDRDLNEHWKNGENGEKLEAATHELDEMSVCTVCGSTIVEWGDGSADVYNYDADYNLLRNTSYDAVGNVTSEYLKEVIYDENGNAVSAKTYLDGVLIEEAEYTVIDGYAVMTKCITYWDDRTYQSNSFDENGNLVSSSHYEENGELVFESVMEYSWDSEVGYYNSKATQYDYTIGNETVCEYNQHGDPISICEMNDAKMVLSSLTYEYEYDDEGRKTYQKYTENGHPVEEIFFGYHEEEDGWWSYYQKHIVYNEDGSYTICEYDENDELLSETAYNSDGSIAG